MRDQWVLPFNHQSTLVRKTGAAKDGTPRFEEVGTLAMKPGSPWGIEGDTVVFVEGRRVHVVRGAGKLAESWEVPLPKGVTIHAVALRDGVAYLGGKADSVEMGMVDTRRRDATWESLPVPRGKISVRKAVDGLVFDGNTLIAVDDFLIPLYLILYDVSDPRSPQYLSLRSLTTHSGNEHISSVSTNGQTLALLSDYGTHGACFHGVSLLDLGTLRERALLECCAPASIRRQHNTLPIVDLRGVSLSESRMFLAASRKGIGHIDLERCLPAAAVEGKVRRKQSIAPEAVSYFSLEKQNVVGVEAISDTHVWAIVSSGRRLDARCVAVNQASP